MEPRDYKYLFRFGQDPKFVDLLGPSIVYFWNDIYDLMDLYRQMIITKLDKSYFSEAEVKTLAKDLIENMEEDDAEIWLEIEDNGKSLHFFELDNIFGFNVAIHQLVISRYFGFENEILLYDSHNTRILYFTEIKTMICIVSLEDIEEKIKPEIINQFIAMMKDNIANEKILVSYSEADEKSISILEENKIITKQPDTILKEINEMNLEIALSELNSNLFIDAHNEPFNKEKFGLYLDLVEKASTNMNKKNTLESLANYLFNSLTDYYVIKRNERGPSEEFDLLISNESKDQIINKFGSPIAIECRHRKKPAQSKDVRDFLGKLKSAGLKCGIIISLSGITGKKYDAVNVIREARKKNVSLIILTLDDLIMIKEDGNINDILKNSYYKYI